MKGPEDGLYCLRGKIYMAAFSDHYIIDIDGTVLGGEKELNRSSLFIKSLEKKGIPYLLATNSIKSSEVQVRRLQGIGLTIPPEKIYSPVDSINQFILRKGISRVMVVGSDEEIGQIRADYTDGDPELIILLDFEKKNATYAGLQNIVRHMERGRPAVSASGSPYYLKNGARQIDTGAFVGLLESVTNRKIEVLGKPSLSYFLNAGSILAGEGDSVTVIGDDWRTDILGARDAGFRAVLVRSGKYEPGDEDRGRPDRIVGNLSDLLADFPSAGQGVAHG